MPPPADDWITSGRGIGPAAKWSFGAEGALSCMDLAAETGELFVADQSGTLFRLDRHGRIGAITHVREPIRALDWSDDGTAGVVLIGENTLHRMGRDFQSVWKLDLPEVCLAVALSAYGTHVVASFADGRNAVFSEHKRRESEFETIRPLSFLRLCTGNPVLLGASEHDLLCCHALTGEQVWQDKLWHNVGGLCVTGEGDLIYVASFLHGIQTWNGQGENIGSYVVEGAVNRVSASFEPNRLIASTLERQLYWLDADGQLLWATTTPEDVAGLHCDPFGEWVVCGFASGRVVRLDWGGV